MMSPDWARMMARYNTWQNENIVGAADTLDDAARRADRGAWFASIHGTLSHLLWGDLMWMSRLAGGSPPPKAATPADTAAAFPEWGAYKAQRRLTDRQISDWAAGLDQGGLGGDLSWYSGAAKRDLVKPRAICIAGFFNHQTHHRGQVHAMLTAAGVRPGDTDLFLMPESI